MRITKTPTAVTPRYIDNASAGILLYVDPAKEYEIQPDQACNLPTGICVEIPRNCFGAIYPQGNLHKKGLIFTDTIQIISSSYRGEIVLSVRNILSTVLQINGLLGLRTPLAQLIIQPYKFEKIDVVEELGIPYNWFIQPPNNH